jgi:hypothetical protein
MANIGTLAAKLSLDPGGWISGIDKATQRLSSFTGGVGKAIAAPGNLLGSVLSAPLKAIGSFLGPIHSLLSSIPLIGAAFAAVPLTGAGFFSWIEKGMERIKAIGRQAETFGIQTQRMGALLTFAGGNSEVMTMMLSRLAKGLGAVAAGDDSAARSIRQLGLDAEQIGQLPLDEAFLRVTAALHNLPTVAERAKAAVDIFSRAGASPEALSMLERIATRYQSFEGRHLGAGGGITADQVRNNEEALRAFAETGRALERLQTQLAVQLARTSRPRPTRSTSSASPAWTWARS